MFEFLTSLPVWGTIVNTVAVIAGSFIGLLAKKLISKGKSGGKLDSLSDALMKGIGLCVLIIGVTGAVKTENILLVILSVALGTVIGTCLSLDHAMTSLGEKLNSLTKGKFGNITQGFVSGCLFFCVGSMTIVGALNSGLNGDHTMLYTKSLLDFVSSIIFASTLGIGVMFSSAFVLVFQGSITLLARQIAPVLSDAAVNEMTAVGSLLIIGLSLNMLGITKLKIMDYIPAIFIPLLLCLFM